MLAFGEPRGVPLRACWRLLGWSQEPLLLEIWRAPKRLLFAGLLGAVASGSCCLWGLWAGSSGRWQGLQLLLCNAAVFGLLACYSFLRFKLPKEQLKEVEKVDSEPQAMSQQLVQIEVDGFGPKEASLAWRVSGARWACGSSCLHEALFWTGS